MAEPSRLIVGISGASGVIYGVRLLQALKKIPVESHLVMTRTAEVTLAHETRLKVAAVRKLADAGIRGHQFTSLLALDFVQQPRAGKSPIVLGGGN